MPEPPLAAELLTDPAALDALRDEWWALWARDPRATPFQTPAWLLAWWRHRGGRGMRSIALRAEGRLVGLAPLFVWDAAPEGRRLAWIGAAESDHLDLLAEAGSHARVAGALLAALRDDADAWDAADLQDVPGDSPLLAADAPPGLLRDGSDDEPCPVLRLPPDRPVEAILPRALAKNLAYARRRAARDHRLEIEEADAATLDARLDHLFDLHARRWTAAGEPGALADPSLRALHGEAARGLLERGLLRLFLLRLDDAPAAAYLGFHAKDRAFYYLGGFDPAFERRSPGALALLHAVERAHADGARTFEFLRGREPYKYAWGATDTPKRRLRLRPP